MRIYKRCCQLRETSAIKVVLDQIAKPSSTLSETPGTVAALDLSGTQLLLQDIITLGDWLAVVPVRKLMLDNCGLTDEGIRVILAGLAGCKSPEQAKQNKKLPRSGSGKRGQEQLGVVEKLSLKNNQFTAVGWRHIALFLHISRSIRGVDLSGNPFPSPPAGSALGTLSRSSTASSDSTLVNGTSKTSNIPGLFVKALAHRYGDLLEELIFNSCSLTLVDLESLVECAIKCKVKRLGLADNSLSTEALIQVSRYVKAGSCEGLDLGSNDLHNRLSVILDALEPDNPLFVLGLSDSNLTPSDLSLFLPSLVKLSNFRFIDLSHNRGLFSSKPSAVPALRKYLPKLTALRRIHLVDVGLTPDDLIAITEILPECPALAHISVLENERLTSTMNSAEESAQEEACAMFASLMTAARVSKIVAVEIEVPSAESSEVVKALASQVVAYTLRNMERSTLTDYGVPATNSLPDKDAPEVLLHLVGHMEGYSENHDNDEPAPDEDYVIASTGIVKALRVCLATNGSSRAGSRNMSPTASGTATPRKGSTAMPMPVPQRKPRNVSLELCESARKIRMRLRPALIREDQARNELNYRKYTTSRSARSFSNNSIRSLTVLGFHS